MRAAMRAQCIKVAGAIVSAPLSEAFMSKIRIRILTLLGLVGSLIGTVMFFAGALIGAPTVTDATGYAHFEGPLLPDGRVTVAIDAPVSITSVCVRLETVRWHRQAEVEVCASSNAYAFG